MVFGHLPFGYITAKILVKRFKNYPVPVNQFMFWAMFGAIAPDTDLLYYYVVDYFKHHSPHQHHYYLTHFPIFWLTLLLISTLWLIAGQRLSTNSVFAFVFTLGGFFHMVLDTVTGSVLWLAPFRNKFYSFETNHPWQVNYFTHWGFGLELCIIVWAIYLWYKSPSTVTLLNNHPNTESVVPPPLPRPNNSTSDICVK